MPRKLATDQGSHGNAAYPLGARWDAPCIAPLVRAESIHALMLDTVRSLTIPAALHADRLVEVQRWRRTTADEAPKPDALAARLARLRDVYELGEMDKADYLAKCEAARNEFAESYRPAPSDVNLTQAMEL